jgi:hypothetical protein
VSDAAYQFFPWVTRGVGAGLGSADDTRSPLPVRLAVDVGVEVNGGILATAKVQVHGPGDVLGLDPRQIVRTEPTAGTTDFEPNYFAHLELAEAALPWLFTPAAPDRSTDQLRPWCVLVVVADQDGVSVAPGPVLPVLHIRRPADWHRELPDLAESWAWVHSQVVATAGTSPDQALAGDERLSLARLLCPRRLDPLRSYHACLVPAFDAGVAAGLGDPFAAPTIGPAWDTADEARAEIRLPVYHYWQFATGPVGDFESLVQRLTPRPLPETVGRRPMFVGDAGSGLPTLAPDQPGAIVDLEGALRRVDQERVAIPEPTNATLSSALQRLVDSGAERLADADRVSPLGAPLYGHWPADRHTIAGATPVPAWLRSLNLDPRDRAAAAAGARAVQANQEALVHSAWEQLGEAESANRRYRELQLARAAATSLHRRHLAAMQAPDVVQTLGPAASRLRVMAATLQGEARRSVLPDAALGATFRKLTRPTARLERAAATRPTGRIDTMAPLSSGALRPMTTRAAPDGAVLAAGMNQLTGAAGGAVVPGSGGLVVSGEFLPRLTELATVPTRPPRIPAVIARPSSGVVFRRRFDDDVEVLDGPVLGDAGDVTDPDVPGRFQLAVEASLPHLTFQIADPPPPPPALVLDSVAAAALEATRPDARAALRAAARVAVPAGIARPPDPLAPIRGAPAFPIPLVDLLGAVDREYVLPGLQNVDANTVGLAEVNRPFVEAALVGANHEMAAELAWRMYPVKRRATFFRRFWARPPGELDIPAIDEWPAGSDLGDNAFGSREGELILIVRGDLVRRYPGTVIYAAQATFAGDRRALVEPPVEVHPTLSASLAPDVMLRGFPLTEAQVRGGDPDPLSNPTAGWFFVIASQPTEPRFGLDVADATKPLTDRKSLNWAHLGPEGDLSNVTHATVGALASPTLGPLTWGRDAAQQAAITLQDPVRIVVHARHLLGPRRA